MTNRVTNIAIWVTTFMDFLTRFCFTFNNVKSSYKYDYQKEMHEFLIEFHIKREYSELNIFVYLVVT